MISFEPSILRNFKYVVKIDFLFFHILDLLSVFNPLFLRCKYSEKCKNII